MQDNTLEFVNGLEGGDEDATKLVQQLQTMTEENLARQFHLDGVVFFKRNQQLQIGVATHNLRLAVEQAQGHLSHSLDEHKTAVEQASASSTMVANKLNTLTFALVVLMGITIAVTAAQAYIQYLVLVS